MFAHDLERGFLFLIPAAVADVIEIELEIGEPAVHGMVDNIDDVLHGARVRRIEPAGFVGAEAGFLFERLTPDRLHVGRILQPRMFHADHRHRHPQAGARAGFRDAFGIVRHAFGKLRVGIPLAVNVLIAVIDLDDLRAQAGRIIFHRIQDSEHVAAFDVAGEMIPTAPTGERAFIGARGFWRPIRPSAPVPGAAVP